MGLQRVVHNWATELNWIDEWIYFQAKFISPSKNHIWMSIILFHSFLFCFSFLSYQWCFFSLEISWKFPLRRHYNVSSKSLYFYHICGNIITSHGVFAGWQLLYSSHTQRRRRQHINKDVVLTIVVRMQVTINFLVLSWMVTPWQLKIVFPHFVLMW